MSREARLAYICRRLNEGARLDAHSLAQALEVNRSTIFRDLEYLRDRLQAPIEWDDEAQTYRLTEHSGPGARFIVPGLWMNAETLYGMLVVLNLASALDPGVVRGYRDEFGRLLKKAMSEHGVEAYGLDQKISVDLPQPPDAARAAMKIVGPALVLDSQIRIHAAGLPSDGVTGTPTGLRLRADGWHLELDPADGTPTVDVPLADLSAAEAIGRLNPG